jgi:hypothetical protein
MATQGSTEDMGTTRNVGERLVKDGRLRMKRPD